MLNTDFACSYFFSDYCVVLFCAYIMEKPTYMGCSVADDLY